MWLRGEVCLGSVPSTKKKLSFGWATTHCFYPSDLGTPILALIGGNCLSQYHPWPVVAHATDLQNWGQQNMEQPNTG